MIEKHRIKVLISNALLKVYIREVAERIDVYYRGLAVTKVILLGALTGAFVFMSELLQELEGINEVRLQQGHERIWWLVDFVDVESYRLNTRGTMSSSGEIRMQRDSKLRLAGEHVLIVEDVADTCRSLDWLVAHVKARECQDCQIAVMLRKPCGQFDVFIRFVARDIPNEFVVGMGLDWMGLYRGLPCVGVVVLEQGDVTKT